MNTFLQETESPIWEFPSIAAKDASIIKYDFTKVYEDSHGAGTLEIQITSLLQPIMKICSYCQVSLI